MENKEEFKPEEFDKESPYHDKILLWKKNYGTIYELVLFGENGEKYFSYFKKPDRMTMMYFYTYFSKDKMQACETLYNTCKIEGDSQVDIDDGMYMSVLLKMPDLIDYYSSSLKKN